MIRIDCEVCLGSGYDGLESGSIGVYQQLSLEACGVILPAKGGYNLDRLIFN